MTWRCTKTCCADNRRMSSNITLITGGSRGIGAATARLCAQRGHAVAINYARDEAAAQALLGELHAQGARAIALQADVSVEAEVLRLFAAVDRELGPLTGWSTTPAWSMSRSASMP